MYELKQRRAIVHHDVGCVEEQQPVAQVRKGALDLVEDFGALLGGRRGREESVAEGGHLMRAAIRSVIR